MESQQGAPHAVVFTYACHNTTIRNGRDGFYKYHPDYAGAAAERIEKQLPGAMAIYVTGAAGEIDPQPQGGVEQAEIHGETLSGVVLGTLERARQRQLRGPLRTTLRVVPLPLAPVPSRRNTWSCRRVGVRIDSGMRGTSWRRWRREGCRPRSRCWSRSGGSGTGLTLVALSGEVGVDYALRLKREFGAERIWPVAYANEVPCYIPSERVLREGGYEAGWDREQGPGVPGPTSNILFYGWAAPLAAGVEERIIGLVRSMLKE